MKAYCGFNLSGRWWSIPPMVLGVGLRLRATVRGAVAAVEGLPVAGSYVVVGPAGDFDSTHWLPAKNGGWGTGHLGVSRAMGTVLSAELGKAAPVEEQEDVHGVLYKARIGTQRLTAQMRLRVKDRSSLETGEELLIAGAVWWVVEAQQVWTEGEWSELNVTARRWPTLGRMRGYGPATLT